MGEGKGRGKGERERGERQERVSVVISGNWPGGGGSCARGVLYMQVSIFMKNCSSGRCSHSSKTGAKPYSRYIPNQAVPTPGSIASRPR